MNLTTRLAIAMIALVAASVSAVGWLSYRSLEQALLPRVLDRLEAHARLVAADLQSHVRGARADVATFQALAAAAGIVRARLNRGIDPVDHVSEAMWRGRLVTRLVAELAVKPAYAQFRLIGISDGAREIIRVDRSGLNGAVRIVPDDQLQRKADRPYFQNAIKLQAGEIHISQIDLNQENGIVEKPHVPTLRVATPILAPDGKPFGIAVINVDMRPAFARVRASSRQGGAMYVVNEHGDYLVHPNSVREFGTQLDNQRRWQGDFPDLIASLRSEQGVTKITHDYAGRPIGAALAPAVLAGSEWIGIIETIPIAVAMEPAAAIQKTSLLVGLAAILCAGILAVFIARSLTRPIIQLTNAVEGLGRNNSALVQIEATGETGVLARAFTRVMDEVRTKTDALEKEVAEHRRTEIARGQLADRVRVFSAAVESSNDAIVTKSLDGMITGWNPAAERLFGFATAEAVGKRIDIIVPPERLDEMREFLRRIGRGEKVEHFETVRLHKNGGPVEVSLSISPIKSPSGTVIGASKIARNISESKRMREALLESEQLAHGIIDTALDAFVQIDETGGVVDWNSRAEEIFGWTRSEAIGKNFNNLIIAETARTELNATLERFLRSGEDQTLGRRREIVAQRSDGRKFPAELSITALQRRQGVLFNGFFRDLTDKIAAEERIRQTEKMEALGQFTGGIAHDFNNILTVITGTIEILTEAVAEDPSLLEITMMIDEAATRGANLTQDLLSFARKQPLEPRETDVNSLIIDTARLLRPTLGEHIEIESVFEEEVCLATVDPSQLSTALLNLAINARDAMPGGGKLIIETRSIRLDEAYASMHSEVQPGRYALIAVSDTGVGIPTAILDKVFDPFFTSKEPGKGTGLGLSMVYGFVKQSAGHIKIYSEEGHGTTIKIYLPPGTGAALVSEAAVAPVIEGGHERILVVEDDRLVRDYVIKQLHTLGYTTLAAGNAAEGLSMVDAGTKFDLLFTDVIMSGGVNGRQFSDEARKRQPHLKVLFTSGYTENAIIHNGRLDAGVLLLAKPYRKSELAKMIRKALES